MTRTQANLNGAIASYLEWAYAFYGCGNLRDIGPGFSSGWDTITKAGDYFANNMFANCTGLEQMQASFSMPQGFLQVEDGFAEEMFAGAHSCKRWAQISICHKT